MTSTKNPMSPLENAVHSLRRQRLAAGDEQPFEWRDNIVPEAEEPAQALEDNALDTARENLVVQLSQLEEQDVMSDTSYSLCAISEEDFNMRGVRPEAFSPDDIEVLTRTEANAFLDALKPGFASQLDKHVTDLVLAAAEGRTLEADRIFAAIVLGFIENPLRVLVANRELQLTNDGAEDNLRRSADALAVHGSNEVVRALAPILKELCA